MKRVVFLDRDGTINVEKNHLYKLEDWEWIPGAREAIKGFNELGFTVIVVTNQSGIARGMYGTEDVNRLHRFVDSQLLEFCARIDGYYFCPHHPDFGENRNCNCRKPKPGLLIEAQQEHGIDLSSSFTIGDKISDVSAGLAVGTGAILVATGYGESEACKLGNKQIVAAKDLFDAYRIIKTMNRGLMQ